MKGILGQPELLHVSCHTCCVQYVLQNTERLIWKPIVTVIDQHIIILIKVCGLMLRLYHWAMPESQTATPGFCIL